MRLKSLLFSLLMLAGFSMAQATVVEIGSTSLSNNSCRSTPSISTHTRSKSTHIMKWERRVISAVSVTTTILQ